MEKNVSDFVEEPKTFADLIETDEETDMFDDDFKFDADGNIVFSEEDKELIATDDTNAEEETEPSETAEGFVYQTGSVLENNPNNTQQ